MESQIATTQLPDGSSVEKGDKIVMVIKKHLHGDRLWLVGEVAYCANDDDVWLSPPSLNVIRILGEASEFEYEISNDDLSVILPDEMYDEAERLRYPGIDKGPYERQQRDGDSPKAQDANCDTPQAQAQA